MRHLLLLTLVALPFVPEISGPIRGVIGHQHGSDACIGGATVADDSAP